MENLPSNARHVLPAEIVGEMEDFFPEESVDEQVASAVREEAKALEEAAISDAENDSDGSRRDIYNHPQGSMYSGPVAASVPTSITTMRMRRRSRSYRTESHRSDAESGDDDGASALFLAASARRSSVSSRGRKRRPSSQYSRRNSMHKAGINDITSLGQMNSSSAVVSSSGSASEDEEGGKKSQKRGMLSVFFGSSAPKPRPPIERSSSSTSTASRSTRRSSQEAKKRKGRRRRTSGALHREDEESEEKSESDPPENDPYRLYGSSSSSVESTSASGSSGSNETAEDGRSRRRSRKAAQSSMFLPSFGGADPVFGDSRGDADVSSPVESEKGSNEDGSDEEEPFFLDEITASRQTIYIPDEDLQLLFEGWGEKTYKTALWNFGTILTLGGLSLMGKWIPEWWLRGRGKWREFGRATKVVVKTSHGTTYVVPIKKLTFATPMAISTIFPPTSEPPPTSRNEAMDESASDVSVPLPNTIPDSTIASKPSDSIDQSLQNGSNKPKTNGIATPQDNSSLRSTKEAKLKEFRYVDFRYYRFLLHPISGNFHMSR